MNVKNTGVRKRVRRTLQVAFPLIIQGLVFQLQSLTDKAFLGNLDTAYVSAAGAAQMPYLATMDSIVAISTGLVIIVSKLYGAGEKDKIASYVRSMIWYNTLFGVVIFGIWYLGAGQILRFFRVDNSIIGYGISYVRICAGFFLFVGIDSALHAMLQGRGETKPIMYTGILKVGVNILVSWVLIYGKWGFPAMYVTGAAIGTLVANVVSFLSLFVYCVICKRKEYRIWEKGNRRPSLRLYGGAMRLGVPVGIEYLLWNASNLLLIRFINGFSYRDMAIYTLTFGFQCIVYMIFEGTSKATLSLMGHAIGAGDRREAGRFFYTTILMNFGIVITAAILFAAIPEELLSVFSNDTDLIENGAIFLILIGVIMIPQSVNVICGNAIRANDDTKWMLFSQIFGSVLVVSMSWFLVEKLQMDMTAIYITLFLDESIRGGINFMYYQKMYGRENPAKNHGIDRKSWRHENIFLTKCKKGVEV